MTIEFLPVPGSSDARTKLTTLIAGGSPPDLLLPAGLYGVSLFVDQNIWLDLRPFFDKDGLALDAFVPETQAATRVTNYYGPEGKAIIGVPVGVHDHALAYNEELFSKAGIAVPPSSWSDTGSTREPARPAFSAPGIATGPVSGRRRPGTLPRCRQRVGRVIHGSRCVGLRGGESQSVESD